MAVRDVYTAEEKKVLANFKKKAESVVGWSKPLQKPVATEELIKSTGIAVDYWNPLWRDVNYAASTRWGGIIAPPCTSFASPGPAALPDVPPSAGYLRHTYIGEDWDFFKPIRVNDSFRVWRQYPIMTDITSADGKGPRKFDLVDFDYDVINQKGELVDTFKLYLELTILPEAPSKEEFKHDFVFTGEGKTPDYVYTKEELKFLDRIADEEEVRGAKIRYWEDVKVGENIRPISIGPTTVYDMITFHSHGSPGLPMRELRKRVKSLRPGLLVLDPVTGVTHHDFEWHFKDSRAQAFGLPHAFHFGAFGRQHMARLVTNWMGDDGFLKRFNWRHMARTHIGDAIVGRGKVTNKRVEDGEHLVDLVVSLQNLRGNITEVAAATVSLLSKEAAYTWK